jgi:rhodanese-related sulfurtransferase
MKQYIVALFAILVLFSCKKESNEAKRFRSIGVGMAHNLILQQDGNETFTILDVRTIDEFNSGHIKNAKNIDYINNKKDLLDLNKGSTYLVYCASGRRSLLATEYMNQFGFNSIFNMSGGINEWKATFNTLIPSPYNESN